MVNKGNIPNDGTGKPQDDSSSVFQCQVRAEKQKALGGITVGERNGTDGLECMEPRIDKYGVDLLNHFLRINY